MMRHSTKEAAQQQWGQLMWNRIHTECIAYTLNALTVIQSDAVRDICKYLCMTESAVHYAAWSDTTAVLLQQVIVQC
jgi:hypothetical protein